MRVRNRQSMMSQLIFIRMAASAACGITSRNRPSPSTMASRIAAHSTPETRVLAPARMFAPVSTVIPALGMPAMKPVATLPMP